MIKCASFAFISNEEIISTGSVIMLEINDRIDARSWIFVHYEHIKTDL